MAYYWKGLWQRLVAPDTRNGDAEVEQITSLKQIAATRRGEYAEKRMQAALTADASSAGPLSASRQRVEEAEAAHAVALRKWENGQSRQKSR